MHLKKMNTIEREQPAHFTSYSNKYFNELLNIVSVMMWFFLRLIWPYVEMVISFLQTLPQ